MFTLQAIKDAHSKIKSGADFPTYIQELKVLGITKYEIYVRDGRAVYFGNEGFQLQSVHTYKPLRVANISDKERFKHYLKNHQRGQTDYHTFCKDAAATGVEKWTVYMNNMTCMYYDKSNTQMVEEQIAAP